MDTTAPYVAGLDLGLVCTGIALAGPVTTTTKVGAVGVTLLPLADRTRTIIDLGRSIVNTLYRPDAYHRWPQLVMIEAPDTSSRYGGLVERIQLYHEVCRRLADQTIPYGIAPSPILKGYATGNGGHRGGKKRIVTAVMDLWPEYGKVNDDEADAIILAAMATDRLTDRRRVPDAQATDWIARPSIQWPTIPARPDGWR